MSSDDQALSFGAAAAAYERARPSYPAEAVDAALPAGARTALDVGAGTGKLTRLLAARGLDVVAVEPDAAMREQLARAVPGVRVLAGAAEALPLPDGAVDVVLAAQAWHWVDPARAVPEAARVLRPGGRLSLLWNLRDDGEPWTADLSDLLRREAPAPTDDMRVDRPAVGPPFGPLQRLDVRWVHELTPDGVVDLVASRSYVIRMPPERREALVGRVRALVAEHPGTAGREVVGVGYVTTLWWADLAG